MLSKYVTNVVESTWRAIASDLLAQSPDISLAAVEASARQQVEELVFHTLAGEVANGSSAAAAMQQAVRSENLPVDLLEAIHQHLVSRQLHRRADGKLECRSSRRHRRSQGIYYTPDYIAAYLAQRCLSGWSKPSLPRVFDPACGCGRFLLEVARQLLQQSCPATEVARSLHGSDLDEEAIRVARRILLLTLTRHATSQNDIDTIAEALENNIVQANTLTESRFLPGEARRRVGEREEPSTDSLLPPPSSSLRSPDASLESFDVVLGNPPYRRELGTKSLLDEIAETDLGRRYRAPRMDLWYYFLHRGIELLAPNGRLGFIVGAYWTAGAGAARLIAALRDEVHVDEIFQLDRLQVFPGVTGHHMMLVLSKPPSAAPTRVRLPLPSDSLDARVFVEARAKVHTFCKTPDQLFRHGLLDLEPPAERLLEHLSQFPTLEQLGRIRQGIAENPASVTKAANRKHGEPWHVGDGVFALKPAELESLSLPDDERQLVRPYHDLSDLGRYDRADQPSLHLIYSTQQTWDQAERHPVLLEHLARFRPIMEARRETRRGMRDWWQLHWPREAAIWEQPKLVALQMAKRPAIVPAHAPTYVSFSANVFLPNANVREHLNYFAALLNSRLLWKWFRHHAKRRGVGLEINGHVLARAPIRRIDFNLVEERTAHDQLVRLVDRMLELSRRRRSCPGTDIKREWLETDAEIDRLVCELYDLAEADIIAVEAACQDVSD